MLKHIALELKFLVEIQNYKCRFAKDVNVINELYYLSLKDFENNILYKVFNFYIICEVNTRDV